MDYNAAHNESIELVGLADFGGFLGGLFDVLVVQDTLKGGYRSGSDDKSHDSEVQEGDH